MKSDSFVSVVSTVEGATSSLEKNVAGIQEALDSYYSDYEIVLIGQGSIIDSKFSDDISLILSRISCVRYIQLAGTVSPDVAWAAGLENAIGDFVVLFEYKTDPIMVIPAVVDLCKSGYDVVVGTADQPRTLAYGVFRFLADRVLRAVDYHLPKNATGLRCLSRRAVNSVTSTGRFHHQFYLRIQKTGYPSAAYPYEFVALSRGKSLIKGIIRLVRLIVFNSLRPLRWMSALGFFGGLVSFMLAGYSVLVHVISKNVVPGWTTVVLSMSVLFMIQFIMMALFGEYLGRLLDDRGEQADYSIAFEKNSSVMLNQNRVNVL